MKSRYNFMALTQESTSSTLNGDQIFFSHIACPALCAGYSVLG